ncbi:hypothetical protein ACFYS8_13365 [Kitasatospora sp. NPDC004615]|uniref:hypothetical protein n=1 Tax=Kitasatospora sp. NPDC004615 TaxID=3364017 RepID=UPI00369B9294
MTTPSETNPRANPQTARQVAQNVVTDTVTGGYEGSAKDIITMANNLNQTAARLERAQND